jgi:hypothetical protein
VGGPGVLNGRYLCKLYCALPHAVRTIVSRVMGEGDGCSAGSGRRIGEGGSREVRDQQTLWP